MLTRKQYYTVRYLSRKPVEGASPTEVGRDVLKKYGMNAASCGWSMLRALKALAFVELSSRGRYVVTKYGLQALSDTPEPIVKKKKKKKCKS